MRGLYPANLAEFPFWSSSASSLRYHPTPPLSLFIALGRWSHQVGRLFLAPLSTLLHFSPKRQRRNTAFSASRRESHDEPWTSTLLPFLPLPSWAGNPAMSCNAVQCTLMLDANPRALAPAADPGEVEPSPTPDTGAHAQAQRMHRRKDPSTKRNETTCRRDGATLFACLLPRLTGVQFRVRPSSFGERVHWPAPTRLAVLARV